ncbi:hypothetical protein, partial [Streptomyces sp. NPDC056660]|uniref:hypothetical protein n=1 Tax=Streptomyces sp. NPDC056660 TaxID=3345897 RepID=UPI003696CF56
VLNSTDPTPPPTAPGRAHRHAPPPPQRARGTPPHRAPRPRPPPAGRDALAALLEEGLLASLDERQVAALARIFTNNARVAGLHRPRPFGGNTVMFTSRDHPPETALGLWRPLIKGSLQLLPVDCTHVEMGRPAALGEIGRVLVEQWAAEAPQKGR